MEVKHYNIVPVAKPRMTQRDTWKKRPCVLKYRAFKDECKKAGIEIPIQGIHVIFFMPMPNSWSKKKKDAMRGQPHKQKPDVDNLAKALLDAIHVDDCVVWDIRITKRWWDEGKIITLVEPISAIEELWLKVKRFLTKYIF